MKHKHFIRIGGINYAVRRRGDEREIFYPPACGKWIPVSESVDALKKQGNTDELYQLACIGASVLKGKTT